MSSTTRIVEVNGELFHVMRTTVHPAPYYDVYSCWEASNACGPHSNITHTDQAGWLGRVGTRRWESDLPAMSEERSAAFREYRDEENALAYTAIVKAFPEAKDGRRDSGEIEVV